MCGAFTTIMLCHMRTVLASADPDLTIALQFALRNEPGFEVVASVSSCRGLSAVSASSVVDLFVIDAVLAPSPDVLQRCRLAGPPGVEATIALLAAEGEVTAPAGVVVRRERPSELLETLRAIRRERRH